MTTELRVRNQAQQLYTRAISQAWRNGIQLYDPSLWLTREPELEEKMLRDADIAHAVTFRRHLIAGRQWAVVPKNPNAPRSPVAVAVATDLLQCIQGFTQARLNLARAFFSGARFGRICGQVRALTLGDGKLRNWWVPVRIEDLDKRMYRIVPKRDEHDQIHAHWERWDVATEKWCMESESDARSTIRHVYQDDQATLGYGRGLREALGWWWYAKEHVFQESLQAVERFAQGILTARVDGARDAATGLPNTELINAWRDVLEDLRARHVLVYDSSDEVSTVSPSGEGWQLMTQIRAELRSSIHTLILGANLTTAASEGGSYALAEVQENSTEALIQYDRETLEETLSDDLIGSLWYHNWANMVELGIAQEIPRFNVKQEKMQDPVQRANVAQVLSAMGVQLSLDDVLEQTGFRKPEPGEEVVTRPVQPQQDLMGGLAGLGLQ